MIIVTGGAGFIGSAIVWRLNQLGENKIIIVDELGTDEKWKNLVSLKFDDFVHKDDFISMVVDRDIPFEIDAVIHMGANSSTTEKDADHLFSNNYLYTKELAKYCLEKNLRFIYASSAATYGDGSLGFDDDENKLETLRPLNMYGYSKQLFDLWAKRNGAFNKIVGLKYFNVYGPNEYHKGRMASVILHTVRQIRATGKMRLFRSHRPDFADGQQSRDFIYVKDVVDVCYWLYRYHPASGLYNLGTGVARSFLDLATLTFQALDLEPRIEFIDTPGDIRDTYQYFTQADMGKLRKAGYDKAFYSLEAGIDDYVRKYLQLETIW